MIKTGRGFDMRRTALCLLLAAWIVPAAIAAEKYTGPRPPKPDMLYLVHADNLVATEAAEAKQESGKKDETVYTMPGANSSARTPLAEPIFLIESDKILPERLELYRWDVKNGHRELLVKSGKRGGSRPLHLSVTKLDGRLYRVEASEPLTDGQYSVSPNDSNHVFCFEVF
jgi:hypothetical protein